MQVVRCNTCRWIGGDFELGLHYDTDTEYCPRCKDTDALVNVNKDSRFDSQEIEMLWDLFGDVMIGDDDLIQEEFLDFPEGTNRMEIWHWFDEKYQGGVAKLMNARNEAVQ